LFANLSKFVVFPLQDPLEIIDLPGLALELV
jgi:hypothetical protein